MVSELAIEDIERIQREGGVVPPRDVIRLNALGLKITNDPRCDIATLPRIAFFEGIEFKQPTVKQDMFLDDAFRIYNGDEGTMLALEAYVLAHDSDDIDEKQLRHPKLFAAKVQMWIRMKLGKILATDLRRIIDYCLYGCDQTSNEFPIYMLDDKADAGDDMISGSQSWVLHQYLSSASLGIDTIAALRATSPQLSAMIERAYIVRGMPITDYEKQATADYYRTLNEIRKRVLNKDEEKEVKKNG